MDPDQAAAYARAVAEEEAWLARIRRHLHASLAVLPLVSLYFIVAVLAGVNGFLFFALLPLPGVVAFGALLYAMGYSRHAPPTVAAGGGAASTEPAPPTTTVK